MKKSRFSEEQIIGALREAGGASTAKAVCAKHNISEATISAFDGRTTLTDQNA